MDTRPTVHKATPNKSTSASAGYMSRLTTVSHPPNLPSGNTGLFQTMQSSHTGGAWPKVEEKPIYAGMLYSDREPDRVSPREESDFSSLAQSQSGTITRSFEVRVKRHLNYFTKSGLLKNIEKEFNVHISIPKYQNCIEIKGSDENVKLGLNRIGNIATLISVNRAVIMNERAVRYFKEGAGDEYVASVERCCGVFLEKEMSYSTDGTTVRKQVSDENIIWTCLGRELILEKNNVNEVEASIKVIPVVTTKSGKVFSKNENIVEMEIGWEPTPNLERLVTEVLKKALEDRKRVVALPLSPVGNWTFDKVIRGFVDSFIQWLFLQQSTSFPSSILLFTETVDYYDKAESYTQGRILEFLNGKCRPNRTIIHLVKGQLDQTQADVLVNTTEPYLDLTYGNVSAAILRTAGPGLQQECRQKYPTGITKNSVAVTAGHGLKCKQVFHITLPVHKETMESIENVRKAMAMCLQKVSENGYASIAFPAIGTGRLKYPSEIVLSEMFGGVERFRQECPDTSLRHVYFVIFPDDVHLYERFERNLQKFTNEVQTKRMQTTVNFNITGMPEDVQSATEIIKSDEQELKIAVNNTVVKVIPAVSSIEFLVLMKLFRKEIDLFAESVMLNHKRDKNEIEMIGPVSRIGVLFYSIQSSLKKNTKYAKV